MLILTRKANSRKDTIFIGDAEVILLSNDGEHVKIGIDAPKTTRVRRGELNAKEEKDPIVDSGSVR